MPNSQNGWPASANRSSIGVVDFVVDGVTFPSGVKSGDVATVLGYVARRFDAEVEPLRHPGCWGYAYRKIEGSTAITNHGSGTAIDINAPRHPLGKRGTFTAAQRAAILRIVDACGGVVRWGGTYSGRVDEMHFEIVGSATAVGRAADRIRGGATPPASTDWTGAVIMALPTLKRGATGDDVKRLQGLLHANGYRGSAIDGGFGPKTETDVAKFQAARKVRNSVRPNGTGDGQAGRYTWTALLGE